MKNYLIITGGNKGIGSGIVLAYKSNGYQIISIARTQNKSEEYKGIIQITLDLSNSEGIENSFSAVFKTINPIDVEKIVLINNAGTLGKIGPIENNSAAEIQQIIQLNTITPFVLSAVFLKETQTWNCAKKIISISSGAAVKSYFGWSLYCASKAAIDMMTKTIAVEQQSFQNGAKIIAIYPGVVDTDMQGEIRKSTPENFVDLQRFIDLKTSSSLVTIQTVGKEIFAIDQLENYANGALLNVADYR